MTELPEPDGLLDAFWRYERALMANDLPTLDRLFTPGAETLRGDAAGLLVGHDRISEFRRGRGGAPKRTILEVLVRPVDADAAMVVALYEPSAGGRGQQTQLWVRSTEGEWTVSVAHVSAPTPAVNSTVWRIVGTPLVAGTGAGPLSGHTVAVKDLFSIAGFAVGGGVPEHLASSPIATETSSAVTALLDAGASVTGIARTDEFAYSIAGRNPHYGTPPNPAVIGGIPGGSSSGPASAVALGQASVGLGTDTGGSIRVPASYQGLWGLRTTHGLIATDGLLPLAPSFDTVGWLARDAETVRAVLTVSAAARRSEEGAAVERAQLAPRFVIPSSLVVELDDELQEAFAAATDDLAAEPVELGDASDLFEIYRHVQGAEAWRTHGAWITAHPGALGDEIAARFAWASTITADQERDARARLAGARERIDGVLGDRVLLLPSASSAAPPAASADPVRAREAIESARAATMRLTCIAGLTGRPALSAPVLRVSAGPVGLCLVGPRLSDLALIDLAARLWS